MLTKNDLVLLLTQIESDTINIDRYITKLLASETIPLDILTFINNHRQLDVTDFYTLLRKNYNSKKSPLYKNLVKEEFNSPADAIITLSVLLLQINLFAKKLEDNKLFLKHSRALEISNVLTTYYETYDLIPCLKLLKLIKADLKVFEKIKPNN